MTIAALVCGRSGTYNALLVDTGVIGVGGTILRRDKLHNVFGETYVTCVGDACLLEVLTNRVKASTTRPNLRDPRVIDSLFAEVEDAHRTGLLADVTTIFPPAPPSTTLVVCNRAEVFFWRLELAPTGVHARLAAPTVLASDSMAILRGHSVVPVNGFSTDSAAEIEAFSLDVMMQVNTMIEQGGWEKLPYDLGQRLSGVVLPHKTSVGATRIDPGVPSGPMQQLSGPRVGRHPG
jgi:hypothetical protein